MAGQAVADAGQAHVFTQGSGRGHVVIIQGGDAVDFVAAGQVADGVGDVGLGGDVGHEEALVDLFRPGFLGGFFAGQQQDAAAGLFGGLDEGQSFKF